MAEARALARVRHRNVVSLLEIGVHEGLPYFVMEYVHGPTLRERLARCGGSLAVDEALGFMTQICRGVDAIHTAGVVHRDLKPSNVLIGPAFRVAVADLGLALLDPASVGGTGSVAGTLAYLAPEALLAEPASRQLAPRADVFALGMMTFELLTGIVPGDGDDPATLLARRIEEPPPRVTDVRPDLPVAFDAVIAAALDPDPTARTPDAATLAAALVAARPRG
jgi:serine/threonine-protein kinase